MREYADFLDDLDRDLRNTDEPNTCLVASKVETRPATDVSRRGTGERADAHQPESGTPINPRNFPSMKTAPLPTRGPIPEGYRELIPGEISKPTDLVWVAGKGPWSPLWEEDIAAGYAYRPQSEPLAFGHFIHIRPIESGAAST